MMIQTFFSRLILTLSSLARLLEARNALVLENLALRQHLGVLRNRWPRPCRLSQILSLREDFLGWSTEKAISAFVGSAPNGNLSVGGAVMSFREGQSLQDLPHFLLAVLVIPLVLHGLCSEASENAFFWGNSGGKGCGLLVRDG